MIHNIDCLMFMKEHMAEKSVDLIVTDPPYEIENLSVHFKEMTRILKPTGSIYVFGDKRMIAKQWFNQLIMPNVDVLAWHYKNSPKPKGRWRMSMQLIIYGYNKNSFFDENAARVPYNEATKKLHGRKRFTSGRLERCDLYDTSKGALPRDVIECPALTGHLSKQRFGHPDQKPIELIKKLILSSSKIDDLIFDPFSGTGTTLVAAQETNRQFLGCELNEKWFTIIKKRLNII